MFFTVTVKLNDGKRIDKNFNDYADLARFVEDNKKEADNMNYFNIVGVEM